MPTLRIKLPDQSEVTHELTADKVTVGRRPDNTIQIIDRSVSAHHAELTMTDDGHYHLRDLGSTNLSFVDGSPITDYHLRQPCRVTFGTVQCEFDPVAGSERVPRMSASQLEKDLAFVRGENADLMGQIHALQHLDRSGNRVALALVTLGLYIAASILMQHSLGPRLFGEMPALAALGYGLALWFTFRIARGISRAGRL